MGSNLGRSSQNPTLDEFMDRIQWLLEEGEAERARVVCRKALKTYTKAARLWVLYGDTLSENGQFREACKAFERGCSLDPIWCLAHAKRAEALLEVGRTSDADEAVETALELDRDEPHATFIRAMVYEFLGRDGVADFWYRRATRLDEENYFRPHRPTWEQFQQAAREAVTMLPPEAAEQLGDNRIRVRDLPSRASARDQSFLRMCDFIESSRTRQQGKIPPVYLYRKNIERVCRDRFDLVEQVYLSLLNEVRDLSLINEG